MYKGFMHVIFCFMLLSCQITCPRLTVLDIEPRSAELLKTLVMRFCYISFVRVNGKQYIIKQKKEDCFRKIVGVVRDAITAHVAESFGLGFAHQVDVIPAGKAFPGKPRTDWPATIHTIAPGKMIKAQSTPYDGMKIKQAVGFTRSMLQWLVKDEALVKMTALDTFLCNHDRHRGNLFYNKKDGSFCAIDMDSAFKYNLCELACRNFRAMLQDQKLFLTRKEIKALELYKGYLEFLIARYQPEELLRLYDYFTEKAGFVEGAALYTKKIALELAGNREMIVKSYQDAQKLVPLVEKVIEKGKKELK